MKRKHGNLPRKGYPVFKRDGFICLKCGTCMGLTIDHIIPKSLGGDNHFLNKQTLCGKCNSNKSSTIVCYSLDKKVRKYVILQAIKLKVLR